MQNAPPIPAMLDLYHRIYIQWSCWPDRMIAPQVLILYKLSLWYIFLCALYALFSSMFMFLVSKSSDQKAAPGYTKWKRMCVVIVRTMLHLGSMNESSCTHSWYRRPFLSSGFFVFVFMLFCRRLLVFFIGNQCVSNFRRINIVLREGQWHYYWSRTLTTNISNDNGSSIKELVLCTKRKEASQVLCFAADLITWKMKQAHN